VAGVLLAFLLAVFLVSCCVFVYGLAIKGVDSYEPEPWWALVVCFFWGALGATFFSIIFNMIGGAVVSVALGAPEHSASAGAATASFVAPLVEESFKGVGLLALWGLSALWLREIDGALDGAIYGGVIGLGFTLTEDVLYIMNATAAGSKLAGAEGATAAFILVFILRTILGGLGHATFTAMTGLGIGIACETRSLPMKFLAPFGGWCAAVGLHFLHNFLVSYLGGFGVILKFMVFLTFAVTFFILLYVLAFRDRAIVLRGLVDEVGKLLHPKEFKHTTSGSMVLPLWNLIALGGSPGGFWAARRKQLALVELAFIKNRRRRGESSQGMDADEHELRTRIQRYNQEGVFVGKR
jgi:RsiW-degrading membrane proteinase PrsW (M82 family)